MHTGVRICLLSVVEEDLRLRNVSHSHMTSQEKRHTLELLLREEEEFLKLQMYVRDERFLELENDASLRGQLHKIVLDMLHCPMRTNEKVLTLLYEEVLQGAHKAQATVVLNELTPIIRRLGELGELWTHKFAENSTKALQKFKLPYDQSRKIFAVHQLPGLREAVYVAIPPSDARLRDDWISFLHEYVHMNALLHSTEDYTAQDMDRLEKHMDVVFELLVTKIGGAERGVTNYFHYIGSGHLMWMIRRYGNLWRFCNEGAESMNSLVSKRYNQHNNKGGNKQACESGPKKKCLPFEVIGKWLGRLTAWHTGLAVDMFHNLAWDNVDWTPECKVVWSNDLHCYVYEDDQRMETSEDGDSDWDPMDEAYSDDSDDDYIDAWNYDEDLGFVQHSQCSTTRDSTITGRLRSTRICYQNVPVDVVDLT